MKKIKNIPRILIILTSLLIFILVEACENLINSECDTVEISTSFRASFSSIQKFVFTASCAKAGCHTGPSPQEGMDLSQGAAFTNLVNIESNQSDLKRVQPGNSTESWIIKKLKAEGTSIMPPPGQLNQAVIDTIILWIDRGALND
jgi:hypothetical protein